MARFSMILLSVVAVVFATEYSAQVAYDLANTDTNPNISDDELIIFLPVMAEYQKPGARAQFSPLSGPISVTNFISTLEGLLVAFEAIGGPASNSTAAQIADNFDANNSGSIEVGEFDNWYKDVVVTVEQLVKDRMPGEDDVITMDEFKEVMTDVIGLHYE